MELSVSRKNTFTESLMCGLVAAVFATALVIIVAIVGKYCNMSDTLVKILNVVIKGVAVFTGVFTQIKTGENGLIKGVIGGLIFALVNIVLFLSLGGTLSVGIVLVDLAAGVIIGGLTGILAVNKKKFSE